MFKGKEVLIALVGDAKKAYEALEQLVEEKKASDEEKKLFLSIQKTIEELKRNPQFGIHIRKQQIPSMYKREYCATNLWKCNLTQFWRLIYWIEGTDDIKIINFVLDIVSHKEYNKKFKYKNN